MVGVCVGGGGRVQVTVRSLHRSFTTRRIVGLEGDKHNTKPSQQKEWTSLPLIHVRYHAREPNSTVVARAHYSVSPLCSSVRRLHWQRSRWRTVWLRSRQCTRAGVTPSPPSVGPPLTCVWTRRALSPTRTATCAPGTSGEACLSQARFLSTSPPQVSVCGACGMSRQLPRMCDTTHSPSTFPASHPSPLKPIRPTARTRNNPPPLSLTYSHASHTSP